MAGSVVYYDGPGNPPVKQLGEEKKSEKVVSIEYIHIQTYCTGTYNTTVMT
jgi:hypothetical protein